MTLGEWCNPNCIWVLLADAVIVMVFVAVIWGVICWFLESLWR